MAHHPIRKAIAFNLAAVMFLMPVFTTPKSAEALQYDQETGLYYNRARMYNPQLGRFMQRDPRLTALILMNVMMENATTPMALARLNIRGQYLDGMSLYQYAQGNPITGRDPTGTYTTAELVVSGAVVATLATIGLYAINGLIGQIAKLTGAIAGYQAVTYEAAYALDGALEHGLRTFAVASTLAYDWVARQTNVLAAATVGITIVGSQAFIDDALMQTRGDLVAGLTIGEILAKYLKGSFNQIPLPPGGPEWKEILKMLWEDIVKLARRRGKATDWARTVKKEVMKRQYWR